MKYYNNYEEIKKLQPSRVRDCFRVCALNGLSTIDKIRGIQDELNKPRVQFIYIHHVFKDEEKNLDKLLKQLALNHCFISYSDAINIILKRQIDKPYISISSDYGLKNNFRAAEILNAYGAKACFFINPLITGNTNFETIKAFCRDKLRFPPVSFLNWSDIEQLLKMGHEVGSHTMSHINMAKSSEEILIEECCKSYEILKEKCGDVKHFAFPYGRFFYFNEIARKTVFASGFFSCASAERGCHVNPDKSISNEELCILRDHILLNWNLNHVLFFLARNSRQAQLGTTIFHIKKHI